MQLRKNRSVIALLSFFILGVSCSNKKNEKPLTGITSKTSDSLPDRSACHQCFDSLAMNKISVDSMFEAVYTNVVVREKPKDQDFCFLFWFLLKSNDESLNESMGKYIFKSFKANRIKQNTLNRNLDRFSKNMRDSLTSNFINLMSVDIGEYSNIDQFKTDFPFFSDSISLSIAKELVGNQ